MPLPIIGFGSDNETLCICPVTGAAGGAPAGKVARGRVVGWQNRQEPLLSADGAAGGVRVCAHAPGDVESRRVHQAAGATGGAWGAHDPGGADFVLLLRAD